MKCLNEQLRNSGILRGSSCHLLLAFVPSPSLPPRRPVPAMMMSFSANHSAQAQESGCKCKVRICGKTAPSVPLQWWAICVICLCSLQQYLRMAAYNLVIGIFTVLLVYVHTGRCCCAYTYIL
jgi:hypothetical protein